MKILNFVKTFSVKAWKWLTANETQDAVEAAFRIVQKINLMVPNRTLENVLRVYDVYGLPISEVLRDGLSEAEIKMLMANAATMLLKRDCNLSTTEAMIAIHAAYYDSK